MMTCRAYRYLPALLLFPAFTASAEAGPLLYVEGPIFGGSIISTAYRGVRANLAIGHVGEQFLRAGDGDHDVQLGTGHAILHASATAVAYQHQGGPYIGSGDVEALFASDLSTERVTGTISAAMSVSIAGGDGWTVSMQAQVRPEGTQAPRRPS